MTGAKGHIHTGMSTCEDIGATLIAQAASSRLTGKQATVERGLVVSDLKHAAMPGNPSSLIDQGTG